MGTRNHWMAGQCGNPASALSTPNPGWFSPGPPVPPVTFSPETFRIIFPVFNCLTDPQLNAYFGMATLYCPNVPQNPFNCSGVLPQLLNLVTAHVAWLLSPKDANGNPSVQGAAANGSLVGRISQATQGSVNVSLEFDGTAGGPSQQFFSQTAYGLMFWQATASIR